jgi:hypothetical protein
MFAIGAILNSPPSAIKILSRISLPSSPKEADTAMGRPGSRRTLSNIPRKMRSGSNQRPRGRFDGNRPSQPSQRAHLFDSNGPSIKIRGSAHQIFDRYVALAREAAIGGDRIAAENFYQHAEHYLRVANAGREGNQQGTPRPSTPADVEMNPSETGSREVAADHSEPRWTGDDSNPADTSTP